MKIIRHNSNMWQLFNSNFIYSNDEYRSQFYKPSHVRFGAYAAGLLLGYWLYETEGWEKINLSKVSTYLVFALI